MRTYFLIIILFHCSWYAVAQYDTMHVNGYKYLKVKQTVENDFDSKDTLIKLYRLEEGKRTYLLSHYTYRYGMDCNNIFKNVGKIECRGDSMIFETHYFQKGHDPIPEKQKQIYKIGAHGKLRLLSDRIYMNGKWMNAKELPGKKPD